MKTRSIENYEQRLIAFIDVLGWRQFVDSLCHEPDQFDRLLSVIEGFEEHSQGFQDLYETDDSDTLLYDAEVSLFSDTIVVSCSDSPEHYLPFLSGVATMCFDLLGRADLLCRGGISSGRLFHSGQVIFGDGLHRAYELETKRAKYPRVVVDRDVVRYFFSSEVPISRCPLAIPSKHLYLRSDPSDGMYFLDYLRLLFEFGNEEDGLTDIEKARGAAALRERIIAMRMEAPREPGVAEKYEWYRTYFNSVVGSLGISKDLMLPANVTI